MFTSACSACGTPARFEETQIPAGGLTTLCPKCGAVMKVVAPAADIIDLPAPKLKERPREELPDLLTPVGPRSKRADLPDLLAPVGPHSRKGVSDLLAPVGPTSTKNLPDLLAPVGPTPRSGTELAPVGPTPVRNAPQLPQPVGPVPRGATPDLLAPVGPEPRSGTDLMPVGPAPVRTAPELPQPVGPEPTKGVELPAPRGFFDEAPPPRPAGRPLPPPPPLELDDLDVVPAGSSDVPRLDQIAEARSTTPPFAMDGLDLSPPSSPDSGLEADLPYGEVDLPPGEDPTAGLVSFSSPTTATSSSSAPPALQERSVSQVMPAPAARLDLAGAPKARSGTIAGEEARATAVARPPREARKPGKLIYVAAGVVALGAAAFYAYTSVELTVGNFLTAPAKERRDRIDALVAQARKLMVDDKPAHWHKAIETAEQAAALEVEPKTLVPKALVAQAYMAAALDEGLTFKEDRDRAEALVSDLLKGSAKHLEIEKATLLLKILDPGKATEAYNGLENVGRRAPNDPDAALFAGWAALEARDAAAAQKAFTRALELAPNRKPALYGLGRAQMALGDRDRARAAFQKVFDQDATSKHFGAWLALTELSTQPRDPTGKRERELGVLCERAPERETAHPRDRSRAWTLYADEALAANRHEAAAERYRVARELDNRNLDALVGRAAATIELRSAAAGATGMTLTDARRDLEQALAIEQHHLGALLGMTRVLLLEGRPDEARQFIDVAIAVDEKNAVVHYWRGKVLEDPALADLAEAERAYLRAVELAPRDYAAYVALSQLYLARGAAAEKQGKRDEASDYTSKAVGVLQPIADAARSDPHMANILGGAYLGAHDTPRAEEWFRMALATDAKYVDARMNLAATLETAGKLDEAVAEYQRAHELAPKREDISLSLALALEKRRDFERAEKIYQALLSTAGGNVPTSRAHAAAGRYFARRGRIDLARREGEIVAASEPGNPAASFLLGIGLLADGKLNDANKILREAVALDPQAQYYEALARVLEEQKNLAEAQVNFEQASKLDGSYAAPLIGLGRVHLARRYWDAALTALERAARLEPENDQVWIGIGDANAEKIKRPEAVAAYQKALAVNAKNAETHYKLGRVYFDDDRGALAITHLRKAIELAPGGTPWVAEAWRLLGRRYYASGQRGEMCTAYRRYLELAPSTDLMRAEVKQETAGCP
jgi:tetratricopeptide (TPR) repeat protein